MKTSLTMISVEVSEWTKLKLLKINLAIYNPKVMQFIYNKLIRCEIRRGAMWKYFGEIK